MVERDSWNLYTVYPLFPCSDFVSQMWGWFGGGGGGGCNVFLTFYAISNISREKKICEYKPIRLMPKGINILSSYCLFLSLSLSIYLSLSLSFSLSNFSNTAFQTGITTEVVDRIPPS